MKITKCLLIVIIILSLSGCWNQREIEDLAMVMGMGIDKAEDGFLISLQVVNPNYKGSSKKAKSGPVVSTFTSKGPTISSAIVRASDQLSKHIFYGTLSLILIGEDLAKDGLKSEIDFLQRNPNITNNVHILIARGNKAAETLSILTSLEQVPSSRVLQSLRSLKEKNGTVADTNLDEVVRTLLHRSDIALTGITVTGNSDHGSKAKNIQSTQPKTTINFDGVAIIKKGRLDTWISGLDYRGFNWVKNKINQAYVSFKCKNKKDYMTIKIDQLEIKKDIQFSKSNKPIISISLKTAGVIEEANCSVNLTEPTVMQTIEMKTNKKIKSEITKAIQIAKETGADLMNINDIIHRKYPKKWHQMKKTWDQHLKDMRITIKVHTNIRRSGRLRKSV